MTEQQLLRVCNWNRTHDKDKYMNEVDRTRHYDETHGTCEPCRAVIREEIKARAKKR